MALELRVLGPDDRAALIAAVDRARAADEFRASSDPDAGFFPKAFDQDPRLVGGAFDGSSLVGFISPEFKIVVVAPERRRRGTGRALIDLGEAMEAERGRADVIVGRRPDDDVALAFVTATGFSLHSTLWELALPSDRPLPNPVWPAGYQARTFAGAADVEGWVRLFNTAFADHPTPLQLDATFVTAGLDDPEIDDADTLLLADLGTGDLVGFCATAPDRRMGKVGAHGEIWTVGVRPDHQGRGLGRQLLRWGVARLRELGVTDISLAVNGRNEHALRLYEDEGFVRTRSAERWARPVRTGESSGAASTPGVDRAALG